MTGIAPVVSLLVVVVLSLMVVRVATVALSLTGLSDQLARFQARSAFTGAGFTTDESEKVVQHPVRRRIIMLLMLLGNAGFITAISSLILSLTGTDNAAGLGGSIWFRLILLISGLLALWMLAHSRWVDQKVSDAISRALKRWTDMEVRDYAELLHLSSDFAVGELMVEADDWLADRSLADLKLRSEGVLVLGIEKPDGQYVGTPQSDYRLAVNDNLLLYGPRNVLANLDERRAGSRGNWEHHLAVEQQVKSKAETEQAQPAG